MDSKAIYKLMVKKCPNTKRNKHYLKRYVRFITACLEKNKDLPEDVYTEKHHILPKAKYFWPEYENFNLYPWNKAVLTGAQHVIAHWILAKALGGYMWTSLWCFISGFDGGYRNGHIPSDIIHPESISIAREEYARVCSERAKRYWTEERRLERSLKYTDKNNPFYGKSHSEETKRRIGDKNRGSNNFWYGRERPEHSEKMKIVMKGKIKSEEHKDNISKSHNVVYTCPHCGQEGGRLLLIWHFDNCFIVNESRNLYKATSPDGKEYLFGSPGSFAKEHDLSKSVICYCLKNDMEYYEQPKSCTRFGENHIRTREWKFEVLRRVHDVK